MTLRIAEDGEDVGGRCGDRALDFDSFGHLSDLGRVVDVTGYFGHRDNGVKVRDDVPMTFRVVIAVAAALAFVPTEASLAVADPGVDASFLDALRKTDITIKSESGAVKAAKAACGMMQQGRPELDVIELVSRQNPGLDTTRAAQFTAIAASAYCPQFLQRAAQPAPPSSAVPPAR
jgi:hypothetical protein